MSHRTYFAVMSLCALASTGCELLAPITTPGPNGEPSAIADAAGALVDTTLENPSWTGLVNGLIAAGVIVASAYTGRRVLQKRRAQQ